MKSHTRFVSRSLIVLVAITLAATAPLATGQDPKTPPAGDAGKTTNKTDAPTPPVLTTEQRLSLENVVLKIRLAQAELQALWTDYGHQVQAIEAAHPGWTWDPQGGLKRKDAPATAEQPKPAAPTEPKK